MGKTPKKTTYRPASRMENSVYIQTLAIKHSRYLLPVHKSKEECSQKTCAILIISDTVSAKTSRITAATCSMWCASSSVLYVSQGVRTV